MLQPRRGGRCSSWAAPPNPGTRYRPRHYSEGRTSGLLSNLCLSPHTSRTNTDGSAEPALAVLLPSLVDLHRGEYPG